jgi:uncharacterized protein YfaP (DUF2135 family)
MLDPPLISPIHKTPSQRATYPKTPIDLAQEQSAAIAGKMAAGEIGDHSAGTQIVKEQGLSVRN